MEAVMARDFMGVPITANANATALDERWHKYRTAPLRRLACAPDPSGPSSGPVAFPALAAIVLRRRSRSALRRGELVGQDWLLARVTNTVLERALAEQLVGGPLRVR